jgi:pyruvate kinase
VRLKRSTPPSAGQESAALAGVAKELVRLERRIADVEAEMGASIERVPEERRESARNLVRYVALRQDDLRDLQLQLTQLGLSSLGRSESWVRGSLLQVSRRAHEALALRGDPGARRELKRLETEADGPFAWQTASHRLHEHTREMLGPRPDDRHVYIMVTAPSAKEADRAWMTTMLRAGMNVLRINCAHEGPGEWRRMVQALADARGDCGRECRLLMDLAGPKIRTGSIAGARHIATWKPPKDDVGRATAPARVLLRRATASQGEDAGPALLLDDETFASLRPGDELRFRDARKAKRWLAIREVGDDELAATTERRVCLVDHVTAVAFRAGVKGAHVKIQVAGGEGAAIDVRVGDELVLTARDVQGTPPRRDREGRVSKPGVIACTLPAALDLLEVGHHVLFDDGRIEATVKKADKKRGDYILGVARTQKATAKLRAEKGINLPDTPAKTGALTADDVRALPFVVEHADAVSLSFVSRPEDVRMLHEELDRLGRPDIGVVLKIERRAAFENLPRILLEGLRRPPLAVMIARGDLAVEVGFERLAELQEEILWLCEASHVPAIWATQVLDTLARTGVPSRAEITDVAASVAAECVMLNKGPFVDEAVRVLSDILRRMEKHHYKKRSLFRKLRVTFAEPLAAPSLEPTGASPDGALSEVRPVRVRARASSRAAETKRARSAALQR